MNHRQANKIVKAVGFHTFRWQKSPSGKMIGRTHRKMKYKFSTITEAFKCQTIYPPVVRNIQICRYKID